MIEHWAEREIKDLKAENQRLRDQNEREDIWNRAFSNPDASWHMPPALAGIIREHGLTKKIERTAYNKEFLQFSLRLFRGACEYLHTHPPANNTIDAHQIFKVLQSSKRYGHLASFQSIRGWLGRQAEEFKDVIEEYGVVSKLHDTTYDRYEHAIRGWWKKHPGNKPPTYTALAKILDISISGAWQTILRNPRLTQLRNERPKDE